MKKPKGKTYSLKQIAKLFFRAFKVFLAFPKPMMLSRTVSTIFNAAVPFINIYFSAQILNELAAARNQGRLIYLVLITISLNLLAVLAKSLINRWSVYCDSQTWLTMAKLYPDKRMSMDYIDLENPQIQEKLTVCWQHQHGTGFGLMRMLWAYSNVVSGIIQIILSITLAFSLFTLKVPDGSAFSFLDSPYAIVAVVAVLLCSIFLSPYLSMVGGKVWAKASDDNNQSNRYFSFYFHDMTSSDKTATDIRIYDQKRLVDKVNILSMKKWEERSKYIGRFDALSTGISYLANGLIYLYVALKAFAGAFGVGSIVQYVGAITQFGSGFSAVFSNIGSIVNNAPFLDNFFEAIDTPNKKYQGSISVEKRDDNEYEIEFHNVSFKYPSSDKLVLKNLNMKLHIGQKLAVVGMNGSGKTTMIKLLCRLYDPTEGTITLNGIDIKKYDYDEYMAIFSVVFQDFSLAPLPLGQNVAASMKYDEKKATHCLETAGFGDRLKKMPNGLKTYLYKKFDENGVEVSGGEEQKIALARALYKNAPFVVLDEPTAALDPIAEYEIYSKFNEIVGEKTAIYISHRLSSCRFCDDIAVFNEGELVERGSHDTLLANANGKYHELWNAQAQYYVETETA